ncbi:MAG: Thermonuclease precursor [Syntrophorhabdus sp. PtaU1.Bin002]|nr:MAG: Thermonuclease precursor [Syntrophorhabdus sp. PtaU1.Bin002]
MNRSSGLFWGTIVVLLGLAAFYGVGVHKELLKGRRAEGKIENGNIVKLVRVVDGDTLVVVQEGEKPSSVRILGIRAFDVKVEKDIVTSYGQTAIDTLERLMADRPIRIMLHSTPKDRYGRYIASLYVDNQDLGLKLIREGLVLAYIVYPFPAMSLYLQEQELARAGRKGLWANKDVTARALALMSEWQRRTE